ncbi:peptidase S24/S26A/S26B/S26C [Zychaea mexicana]|uniref:peptidase S24/S26A/S26B/S26C n=1 Tax=Zychaea mexicana TaxID=64656 RepID=UPI0022FDC096|nr:peptidase S24/S26A/S26B/S26C [Zychaea mexicana]KAI9495657.1 peptidase S24/S26A/S26B/S26C [Zychaea mexicana]
MAPFQYFRRNGGKILRGAAYAVQFMCFAHVFNQYIAEATFCMGPSMLPNFNMTGDIVAVEHITPHFRGYRMGDVVVCISPAAPGRAVLKRILGLPGDNVCVDPTAEERRYIDVPEGHVWLMGDNLSNSTDSRYYGPVAMGLIRGRVFARVSKKI